MSTRQTQEQWWQEDAERLNRLADDTRKSGKAIPVSPKGDEQKGQKPRPDSENTGAAGR